MKKQEVAYKKKPMKKRVRPGMKKLDRLSPAV
jgi:hypothetical protein